MTVYTAGSIQTVSGSVYNTGTILINAGTTSTVPGAVVTLDGTLDNAGTVDVLADYVTSSPGSYPAAGGTGGTLIVTGTLNNTGSVDVGASEINPPAVLCVAAGGVGEDPGLITIEGSLDVAATGGCSVAGVLTVEAGGTLAGGGGENNYGNDTGAAVITVEGTLANLGEVLLAGGYSQDNAEGRGGSPHGAMTVSGLLINAGSIVILDSPDIGPGEPLGGTLTATGTLTNTGTIVLGTSAYDVPTSVVGYYSDGGLNETGLLDNTGTLLVDSYGAVSLVGTLNDSGRLVIGGGAELASPYGYSGGTLTDSGLFSVSGSLLIQGGGFAAASNNGIAGGAGGVLQVAGSLISSGSIEIGGGGGGDNYDYDDGGTGGTLAVSGTFTTGGSVLLTGGGGGGNAYEGAGLGALLQDSGVLINTGTIVLQGGGAPGPGYMPQLYFPPPIGTDATLSVTGSLNNSGSVDVAGGRLVVGSDATISGNALTVDSGGEIDLLGPTAIDVAFGDHGTLVVAATTSYGGTLSGLALNDQIQIDGVSITGATIIATTLRVDLTGGATEFIALAPGQTPYRLSVSQGSDGDMDLLTVQCFAAGTGLATPAGEIAVEALQVGDLVTTIEQDGAVARPIRWIGRRRFDLSSVAQAQAVLPIRIQAGAFADGLPHRDLVLSPDHAVFVDGRLIAIRQLLNGTTIARQAGTRAVEYFHVELDRHALLLAEGLTAESYLDAGGATLLPRAGSPAMLHPLAASDADPDRRGHHTCAPFVTDAATVAPIWHRLAARAAAMGRAPTLPTITTAPELHLRAGDRVLRPLLSNSVRAVFALPPGTRAVQLASRAAAPADLRPWLDDRRTLGVPVAGITTRSGDNTQQIPVDDPTLVTGWWRPEGDGTSMWRWTNGAAILPVPTGADILELRLRGITQYPLTERPPCGFRRTAAATRCG